MNGCVKGKVGEREWRDFLIERGVSARRGQQYQGGTDSPDVVSALDDIAHWEVKRVENLSIYPAMEQACSDAKVHQIPVVAHRRNHKEWLCTMRGADAVRLLKLAQSVAVSADGLTATANSNPSVLSPASSVSNHFAEEVTPAHPLPDLHSIDAPRASPECTPP